MYVVMCACICACMSVLIKQKQAGISNNSFPPSKPNKKRPGPENYYYYCMKGGIYNQISALSRLSTRYV